MGSKYLSAFILSIRSLALPSCLTTAPASCDKTRIFSWHSCRLAPCLKLQLTFFAKILAKFYIKKKKYLENFQISEKKQFAEKVCRTFSWGGLGFANMSEDPKTHLKDTTFLTDTSKFKIGRNIASNRLKLINNKIKLKDLNDKMPTFKVKMKSIFLS